MFDCLLFNNAIKNAFIFEALAVFLVFLPLKQFFPFFSINPI